MSDANRALNALVEAFRALGYSVSVTADRIPFPPLALEFRIAGVTVHRKDDFWLLRVLVEAAAAGNPREGMRVNAIGYGPTEAQALRGAADQWLDGVFPVLHHWMAPHKADLGVESTEMIVGDHDTGRRFGWRVHLGPLLFVRYGPGDVPETLPKRHAVLQALFDSLSARSAHETLFWIEAFVGRVPGRAPEATCLLHNGVWPEGETALCEWAAAQSALAGMSVRQFLLFEPVRPDALASAESLSRVLDAELTKSPRDP
jgi:uncharacterized protein DUF6348